MKAIERAARAGYEAVCVPTDTPMGALTRWATWDEMTDGPAGERERARSRAAILAFLSEEALVRALLGRCEHEPWEDHRNITIMLLTALRQIAEEDSHG